MSNNPAAIRQFLMRFFNDQELKNLCYDYFLEVNDEFTIGMTKTDMILLLLGYCQRRGLENNLLAALEKERPTIYLQYLTPIATSEPAKPQTLQRNPHQIFISHAYEDSDFAHQLADDLKAQGWQVWITPDSIRPGEMRAEAIDRGLQESSFFVLVVTQEAVSSYWVRQEASAAIQLEFKGKMQIVPLKLETCEMPPLWETYQFVSLQVDYEAGFQALLQELELEIAHPNDTLLHKKTGLTMLRIPKGNFLYGNSKKKLYLPEFWISKTPVTQGHYQRFINENSHYQVPYETPEWARPYNWNKDSRTFPPGKKDHPVVLVSWHDAVAYAHWAGLQLPSEQQWEKAARGTDGREYPWGYQEPKPALLNFSENIGSTTSVGKYSVQGDSPYTCIDMSGNVWEWTDSWYEESNISKVMRGGSWFAGKDLIPLWVRTHNLLVFSQDSTGFRLVSAVVSGS